MKINKILFTLLILLTIKIDAIIIKNQMSDSYLIKLYYKNIDEVTWEDLKKGYQDFDNFIFVRDKIFPLIKFTISKILESKRIEEVLTFHIDEKAILLDKNILIFEDSKIRSDSLINHISLLIAEKKE